MANRKCYVVRHWEKSFNQDILTIKCFGNLKKVVAYINDQGTKCSYWNLNKDFTTKYLIYYEQFEIVQTFLI